MRTMYHKIYLSCQVNFTSHISIPLFYKCAVPLPLEIGQTVLLTTCTRTGVVRTPPSTGDGTGGIPRAARQSHSVRISHLLDSNRPDSTMCKAELISHQFKIYLM